jgi:hypothetical protein
MSAKIQSLELSEIERLGPNDHPGDIVLVDKAPHVAVLSLCVQNGVKHVVQKSSQNSHIEIHFSSLMVNEPGRFFQFPLSCILGALAPSDESEAQMTGVSFLVEKLQERREILASVESYLSVFTSSPALVNDILCVIDETLTNAVYNAPFAGGMITTPSREVLDFPIDPLKKPMIFVGQDRERIVVGCRDSYGSLNVESLINRIKSCYENQVADMINFGEGGAGIGSFLMFNSCASMYVGVDAGVSTTICFSFPLKLSAAHRSEMPKNIHVIHR